MARGGWRLRAWSGRRLRPVGRWLPGLWLSGFRGGKAFISFFIRIFIYRRASGCGAANWRPRCSSALWGQDHAINLIRVICRTQQDVVVSRPLQYRKQHLTDGTRPDLGRHSFPCGPAAGLDLRSRGIVHRGKNVAQRGVGAAGSEKRISN